MVTLRKHLSQITALPNATALNRQVRVPVSPQVTDRGQMTPVVSGSNDRKTATASSYLAQKTMLHQTLLKRIDLKVLETLSPEVLREQLKALATDIIRNEALPLNEAEHDKIIRDLQHEIMGLGPLELLLADPSISEIMVNGARKIYVERRGKIELTDVRFDDDAHLVKIIGRIVSRVGRRVDEASPMVDARLPDGSRVNAIIPPLALDGPVMTIRRFAVVPLEMADLLSYGTLTPPMAEFLAAIVRSKANIIISGGTGSGKTTLLNILSSSVPGDERIVTLEDTAELQLQQEHVVRLESRPANIEGQGAIPMRALVKNSLRMRPDRIILGEVRGGEVMDMLQAMNTGHSGSLATVHANNPRDCLARLENLVNLAGISIPAKAMRQQMVSALDFVVQATRLTDGSRKITNISEVIGMEGDVIVTQDIFVYDIEGVDPSGKVVGRFRATGIRPQFTEEVQRHGIMLDPTMFQGS
jgi:pilus assembly protein CpaF